jgi:phosphoenolpyruvate carboxykinase (ATP)
MKLRYTRAMIHAALEGKLDKVEYKKQEFFGLPIPTSCPDVPDELLDPKNTWTDKDAFDRKARELAKKFNDNFKQFEDKANEEILAAAPQQPEQIS